MILQRRSGVPGRRFIDFTPKKEAERKMSAGKTEKA